MTSPTSLPDKKAKEFLKSLASQPFIAMVFEDGEAKVFTKGLDDATMDKVAGLIEQITSDSA